jgi:hypothetical protein
MCGWTPHQKTKKCELKTYVKVVSKKNPPSNEEFISEMH